MGQEWGEGGWCHAEVMGTPQNLSSPLAAAEVAPRTIMEKLPGEAQGMGDVSSLDGGADCPSASHGLALLDTTGMGMGLVAVP